MSLSDFVVLSKIGEGAFSSVHKVKRVSDGNIYALKKVKISSLKEKEKQNSVNQVRILASINSPNIIGYKQAFFDEKSNTLCIVMEYADGGDLEKVISKKKKSLSWVPESEVWTMIQQVLSGLTVLHDMNIIHRDIKCANIFISEGIYKLGDLNVSKLLKQSLAYTQTGTPYYASPQVWNDKPYELKSDIWSLGCIIYEYCALKPPFTANSMEALYKRVMKGAYPRIPANYSEQLESFIKSCLQLDSKKRPTAKQLLALVPSCSRVATEGEQTQINLLNTIRVPRNMQSWREQLPKSNYMKNSEIIQQKETKKNRFGHLSQQKLREIVRQKNPEPNTLIQNPSRKQSYNSRVTPEISTLHEQVIPKNYHHSQVRKIQKVQVLPKIKIHSQPNDAHQQSILLLAKLKEEEKNRKYNYNRPVWWG